LKAKSIESMWDDDLVALSKGLDELEAMEAAEAEEAEDATANRRKKTGGAGAKKKAAPKAATRKRSVVDDSIDEALMSRPLQVGAGLDADEVQKQSWGHGAPPTRKSTASPERARGELADVQEAAASKGKGKGRKLRREGSRPPEDSGAVSKSEEPPEPAEEECGGSLLSRLLKNKSAPGASLAVPASGFSALSGSDDFFSYLTAGQDTSKPYDSLDFGAPPCGETLSAPDPATDEKATKQSKEKAPGKSRKQAEGSGETGGPAKRQKKDTGE